MARHRRRPTGFLVRRSTYERLRRAHEELYARYRSLEDDHVALVGDLEEMMAGSEPGPPPARQTSWGTEREADDLFFDAAATQPVPAMDPDATGALVVKSGLLVTPGGAWSVKEDEEG